MHEGDDDDAYAPQATEVLNEGSAAFDPAATERFEAPPGPKPFDEEGDPTAAIPVEAGFDPPATDAPEADAPDSREVTAERPRDPDGPPRRDDAATALIPGHALGIDPVPLDDLSSSKFLSGSPAPAEDPFGAAAASRVDDAAAEQPPGRQGRRGTSKEEGRAPLDPTGAWDGVLDSGDHDKASVASSTVPKRAFRRWMFVLMVVTAGAVGVGVFGLLPRLKPAAAPAPTSPKAESPTAASPDPAPAAPPPEATPPPADPDDGDPEEAAARENNDDEPEARSRKRRSRRKSRKSRSRRSSRAEDAAPARVATSAPTVDLGIGTMRDASGSGIAKLKPMLARILKKRLRSSKSIRLVSGRPAQGFEVDAWIQKVRKKAADGGNMVEVSCSAALSEQPGGGVKFNTRATTGVGVSETLTRSMIEELAGDALARCARELAKDIDRYARRKARK